MRVTRRYRFSASHRLHSPQLSEDANRELYGKCNNTYGHGHDYVLEVSVRGPVDETTGQVINYRVLDGMVADRVLKLFDHANLNIQVEEFSDSVPTTENVAGEIARRLRHQWTQAFPSEVQLEKIRLHETGRNTFEMLVGQTWAPTEQ